VTTNAYEHKRIIFDRITALALTGGPLDGVIVEYAWPGKGAGPRVVYGGGIDFDQDSEDDLEDGADFLEPELVSVAVHVKVALALSEVEGGIRGSDAECERIGKELGRLFAREPLMCGPNTFLRVRSGWGDYVPSDTRADSTLSLRVVMSSFVDYREE
jgi:hypothetical protein